MKLHPPVNKNLFIPSEAVGLGLETLPTSLEEAVEVAKNSEFLHKFLPEELAKRYYAESLKRCAALKTRPTGGIRTHPLLQRDIIPCTSV